MSTTHLLRMMRVGELTTYLRQLLESNEVLYDLWLTGEVSNVSQTSSGHYFFTLKDEDSQLRCVLFRPQAIWQTYLPEHGAAVLAHGYLSIYPSTGNLQFYVDTLQEAGQGALYRAFEQLKAALDAQGLFSEERKRPLQALPRRIGVVTSPQAAALQDILTVLARRYPLAEVVLAPTKVQGEGAARQIAGAVSALSSLPEDEAVDVVIVARGGGSIEELWAFNEEVVARAIYACKVPVISGVGHETDYTIADYVADVRAPTPSAAAELAAPDILDLKLTVDSLQRIMLGDMKGRLAIAWDELYSAHEQLERLSPMWQVGNDRRMIESLRAALSSSLYHRLAIEKERTTGMRARLEALSPLQILRRGYAIVRDLDTGEVVSSLGNAQPGHLLEIRVADGAFGARVEQPRLPVAQQVVGEDRQDGTHSE